MGNIVTMPKLNADMTEGVITRWIVSEGDKIEKDDPLFEVETGKIVQEVDSRYKGILLKIFTGSESTVPVNEAVCFIGKEGEDIPQLDGSETQEAVVSQSQDSQESHVYSDPVDVAKKVETTQKTFDYDLLVVGGGPGGYTAAIRAAQLGARVFLAEKDKLGGTCLNRGCIPTKSLFVRAEEWRMVQRLADIGINADNLSIDFSKIADVKDAAVERLRNGVANLLEKNNVKTAYAEATILDGHTISIEDKTVTAAYILIATGTNPAMPPVICGKEVQIVTTDDMLGLRELPESVAIIGGGVVGVEFAGILASFGVKVSIIEIMDTLLTGLDIDLVEAVNKAFKRTGISVYCGTAVDKIEINDRDNILTLKDGKKLTAEMVLAAAGRSPDCEAFASLDIKQNEKGYIKVDGHMKTNLESVCAVGDITGISQLAHVASAQGMCIAENLFGNGAEMRYEGIPSCIFTMPELATVGMTESEARQKEIPVKVSRFDMAGNGKAVAEGDTEGFVKIIIDERFDEILGVHIAGKNANLLIAEAALAISVEATTEDVARAIHAHPTRAEALMESALGIYGAMIHG